ncbi:MAG TPA: Na+/H+ antiporter [Leptolyngbyaceae cyanobacterium M33_DOE_097]|uniref:Na+/H+ antiporter n=1 Tax=Oscillatoriales cyanobacterium SpSt-418 TaxID=2282169 RepID=A0A7C3KFK9_9CYAN|nr:Na+/H+ antiporter [Leptolyngbyaceae cyanobacterium M33_DOE_097]
MAVEAEIAEAAIEASLKPFLVVLAVSLSVAALSKLVPFLRRIPYTLLLVIVGLCLAFVDVRLANLSPDLILTIFLPPLLFEAAWNLNWSNLKRNFVPVLFYAVFGVVIVIAGIAIALNQFLGVGIATALLIGASLSATDPVSVTALFRALGVEKRLSTVMEGESLFNDGMAVVAFTFLLAFALGTEQLAFKPILVELFVVVGVGTGVGLISGFGISYLTQRFDLPLVEQSLTLVSAYAVYLVAEDLGGSGVIAVVILALILGNFGSRIGMNPRTRLVVSEFWEFLAFFVNSIVFLLIGDQIRFEFLDENLPKILTTIAAIIITRAIAIYLFGAISNRITNVDLSLKEQTVLWWGGLRGAVSIALALSVPTVFSDRQNVIATVFGVVLFTLLAQGLTIETLLNRLNLIGDQPLRQEFSEQLARRTALKRVLEHLLSSSDRPGVAPEFFRYQEALIKGEISQIDDQISKLEQEHPNLSSFVEEQLREELFQVEADTYAELTRAGKLNEQLAPLLEMKFESGGH